ncbi:hypothetical protein HMPREF9057_01810 [Actinomyces sp. oral taxon 171 str. F0337]|nr:hypothetical protein HMPREF9057_01810 [Actinomyces sp. oral taxon 171 str. F0337]
MPRLRTARRLLRASVEVPWITPGYLTGTRREKTRTSATLQARLSAQVSSSAG